jgi:hypothetical protein
MQTSEKFLWCGIAIYAAINITMIIGALLQIQNRASFDERFGTWARPPEIVEAPRHIYRPCDLIHQRCIIG